jgi:hypothetical protein
MQSDLSDFTVDEISLKSRTEKVILYKSEA